MIIFCVPALFQQFLCYSYDPVKRSQCCRQLSTALLLRYELREFDADLKRAGALSVEAVEILPELYPDRKPSLRAVALFVRTRFRYFGLKEDLERALNIVNVILDACPEENPNRTETLDNAADTLMIKPIDSGASDDLDASILLQRSALGLRPTGHPTREESLRALFSSLFRRFRRTAERDDIDEACNLKRLLRMHNASDSPRIAPASGTFRYWILAVSRSAGHTGVQKIDGRSITMPTTQKFIAARAA
ncbi:unnamed protein product [Somion occarium]|uniref:Uncharacterized protein n=1 Tax=Somion occarium TaxID=3059160 RepID=A0ABP1DXS5_9APHY